MSLGLTVLPEDMAACTVSQMFAETVARYGDRLAFRHTVSKAAPSAAAQAFTDKFEQISYTWKDYNQLARGVAKSLIAHDVKSGEAATIQGSNSPQWLAANVGTILAGGVAAGMYATNSPALCEHVVTDSGAKVVFVEDEKQLQKYKGVKSSAIKCFVVWNGAKSSIERAAYPAQVASWEEFLEAGRRISDKTLDDCISGQKADAVCSLIYTSGTTGNPKGAALTHDCLTWTAKVAGKRFSMDATQHGISYLPLSHIAAQQLDSMIPLAFGGAIDIAPPDALKGSNLKQHIVNAHPTYFLAVPRVWEKFKETMEEKLQTQSDFTKCLFNVCTFISKEIAPDFYYLSDRQESGSATLFETIRYVFECCIMQLLETVIFSKIKTAIGLDRCKFAASGAGVLSADVVSFFAGINIRVIDIYGLSESSGPATIPGKQGQPAGSCGQAVPGTKIKIAAPDERGEGEVCLQGRNIFKGYWNNLDATRTSMDAEGFFHSGDKGKLDANGNLFITGRIKELLKTSGGENIAPIPIENTIKQEVPLLSQVVVIGDKKNYLTCLVTLPAEVDAENKPTNALTPQAISALEKIGSTAKTVDSASADPVVQNFVMEGVKRANLKAGSQAQHVQKVKVLAEEFSTANDTMTATLKLKRSAVERRYQAEINELYSSPAN